MRRTTSLLVGLACLHLVAVGSDRQNPTGTQTFRGGVELLQLDVSVLDKARRPVGDLTAGDFTVLVDGKPHPVLAFKAVSAPAPTQ